MRSLRNGRLYAVKRIKKDTKNKQLIKAIEREKEILCAMRGQRNVTQIHFAFQDVILVYQRTRLSQNFFWLFRKNTAIWESISALVDLFIIIFEKSDASQKKPPEF